MMRAIVFSAVLLVATPAVAQEKHVATDSSLRTILTFKAPAAAIQKLLPDGWEVDSPTSGAGAGSNLRVTFIEGVWGEDAEGKPTPIARTITFGVPARKKAGEIGGLMLVGGLTTGAAPGVYSVYSKSTTSVQRTVRTGGDGVATVDEAWDAKGESGDVIQLQLQYIRGTAASGKINIRVYSGAKPEFYRIYRYTQAADVLRSPAGGAGRVKASTFTGFGPKLSGLLDGAELTSITALPFYSRQIFLPGS
jgi:hypothetical protein